MTKLLTLVCLLLPIYAFAQAPALFGNPTNRLLPELAKWLKQQQPRYIELYRNLHENPELSWQEYETAAMVARELEHDGYTVTKGVAETGVVAVLKNGPGPTLLLRGDMDALPVAEQTGVAYASKRTAADRSGQSAPVMHACGHDFHITNLLATAAFLATSRSLWAGTLVVVAEPAEELGEGALRMIEAGLFKRFPRPDFALALHVDPDVQAGHIAIASGWAAANTDSVDVTLYGRGGHGSRPQDTVDPIVLSAEYVLALQTVISRRRDPQEPAVLTVGAIQGGAKHNVIPDAVHLMMTVRTYSDSTRTLILEQIANLATHLSKAHGSPKVPEIRIRENYTPAVYNDPQLAATAKQVLQSALGLQAVENALPPMSGEDFGRFGKHLHIPSLLMRLGATPPEKYRASKKHGASPLPTLHSSLFLPDVPKALPVGVTAMVALALHILPAAPDK